MEDRSILPYFCTGFGELDDEHERIGQQLDSLHAAVGGDDFARASGVGERLQVELEGHFAFEELIMSRTDYLRVRRHSTAHAMLISFLFDFLSDLRGAVAGQEDDRERLLAKLARIMRHMEVHIAGSDMQLRRHVVRLAERSRLAP